MSIKKDKEDLVKLIISDAVGQIFSCNMLASIDEGLFDPTRLHILLGHLLDYFQSDRASFTSAKNVIVAINKIASGYTPYTPDRCLLAYPVSAMLPHTSRYAHVCRSDTITTYWLVSSHDPDLCLEPVPRKGEEDIYQEALEAINDKIREDINTFRDDATLGYNVPAKSLHGLGWITVEDKVTSIGGSGDTVRDTLGLIDHQPLPSSGPFLVVVIFNSTRLGAHPIARPTFVDGGNSRFRVVPDEPAPKDWGVTVNLAKFAADETIIDGVYERVISPILLRTITPEFRMAGWVEKARGDEKDSDKMFLKRMLRRASLDKRKLKNKLLSLFETL